MWFFSLRKPRHQPAAPRSHSSARPRLETLEDRCLLNAGALDPTFGSGAGYVTTSLSTAPAPYNHDYGYTALLQPSGNIVVVGQTSIQVTITTKHGTTTTTENVFGVVTYNPDGSLDTAFGSGGIAVCPFAGPGPADDKTAALEPTGATGDDKILLAGDVNGQLTKGLTRLNPNGSLDTTFGNNGQVVTSIGNIMAVAVTSSGQIVADGWTESTTKSGTVSTWTIARYNPNGSLDPTFGSGGEVTTTFNSVSAAGILIPQADGKLVVLGSSGPQGLLASYNANGSLDTTFGNGGFVTGVLPAGANNAGFHDGTNTANAGQIVVAGRVQFSSSSGVTYQAWVARYNGNGSLDTTFGNGAGYVLIGTAQTFPIAKAVAIQPDGKVVVVGFGTETATTAPLARLNADGSPDTTFGNGGIIESAIGTFTGGVGGPGFSGMAIQPDGKIVAAGQADINGKEDFLVARYLPSEPEIGSFTANPDPVTSGSSVTLTASNLTDGNADSTITQAAFYVNVNGTSTLLGYGTQSSAGVWTFTFTVNLAPGSYTLTAQAEDSDGVFGDPDALTLTVQ
jgi:uncharacterized delta-60 repeat protein